MSKRPSASGIMVFETENRPHTTSIHKLLPSEQPDRIQIASDDHRTVANAAPIIPVTLAHLPGLSELVHNHVDLGDVPGRANAGDKMLTLSVSGYTTDGAGFKPRWSTCATTTITRRRPR